MASGQPPFTKSVPTLTLAGAQTAIAAAAKRAHEINVPMNIAVVDGACHLLAFERMEGAKITSSRSCFPFSRSRDIMIRGRDQKP